MITCIIHTRKRKKLKKGKHTTTARDLFLLENGSIAIDTPGMREFGVGLEEEAGTEAQFPVIHTYAVACKYKDCSHVNEQGCRVIQAYQDGALDPVVYQSYLKLRKEQKRFQVSLHEKKKQGKQRGKMVKEAKEYRKRYKY
jgi:ribosome biogenesis GTPase